MRRFSAVFALSGLICCAQDSTCSSAVEQVSRQLYLATVAKDAAGAMERVFTESASALRRCPGEETIWYANLRSAELGFGEFPVRAGDRELRSWTEAAAEATRRFPRSARIATIAARADGRVGTARAAVDLDPGYAPAHVALASALLESGDAASAIRELSNLSELARVPGGHELLARAKLRAGDPQGALAVVKRVPARTRGSTVEPMVPSAAAQHERDEVAGLAYLALGRHDQAAASLLEAAAAGRETARREILGHRELVPALQNIASSSKTPAHQRTLARALLDELQRPRD